MSKITFQYPSLLSFKGSISPSLFTFYSLKGINEKNEKFDFSKDNIFEFLIPVLVEKAKLRTTIANYAEISAEKLKESLEDKGGANIQTIEKASLPPDSDTLVISGSVRFFNNSIEPEAINESSFQSVFAEYIQLFAQKIGYSALAERYFMNLINGQILWRNKYGDVQTKIINKENGSSFIFNLDDIDLDNKLSIEGINNAEAKLKAKEFVNAISKALGNKNEIAMLEVISKVVLGNGQIVYPSQEFDEQKDISRVLAKFHYKYKGQEIAQAVFHEQKIGNAIRTIDTWYTENASFPLAIEPYGISQKESKAYRSPTQGENDFYTIFMKIDALIAELTDPNFNIEDSKVVNKHLYVVACLIRGGVYSGKAKKAKETKVKE